MKEIKDLFACTVFDGKIVISGGFNSGYGYLKSVEAYDHYEDKWNFLPDVLFEILLVILLLVWVTKCL